MNIIDTNFTSDQPRMEKLSSSSSSDSRDGLAIQTKTTTSSTANNVNNCNIQTMNKPLPFHSRKELALAERSIQKLVQDSCFFPPEAARDDWFHRHSNVDGHDSHKNSTVSTLYEDELHVERLLGQGGFCQVRLAHLSNKTTEEYAIKYLQSSNTKKASFFARGAADLAIEARFLSLLHHEHIITLHYVSEGTLGEVYNCLDEGNDEDDNSIHHQGREHTLLRTYGYFLVLDYLRDTLLQRIQNLYVPSVMSYGLAHPKAHHKNHRCEYRPQTSALKNLASKQQETQIHWWNKKLWQKNRKEEEEWSQKRMFLCNSLIKRLNVLRQVASALEYLHAHGIVYRDSKFFE